MFTCYNILFYNVPLHLLQLKQLLFLIELYLIESNYTVSIPPKNRETRELMRYDTMSTAISEIIELDAKTNIENETEQLNNCACLTGRGGRVLQLNGVGVACRGLTDRRAGIYLKENI